MTIDRRATLKWAGLAAFAAGAGWGGSVLADPRAAGLAPPAEGYGKDPGLSDPRRDYWQLTLTPPQRAAATLLADVILPGDPQATPPTPAASTLGIGGFFDEWLSAPYPDQLADRALLLPLLDAIAAARAGAARVRRRPEFAKAAERFRVLAAAAYFTTEAGMAAIGFVGNEARTSFEGPPPAVLALLEERYRALG